MFPLKISGDANSTITLGKCNISRMPYFCTFSLNFVPTPMHYAYGLWSLCAYNANSTFSLLSIFTSPCGLTTPHPETHFFFSPKRCNVLSIDHPTIYIIHHEESGTIPLLEISNHFIVRVHKESQTSLRQMLQNLLLKRYKKKS